MNLKRKINKIVVTGGLGFIGRNLIRKLSNNKNNQIICIDNKEISVDESLESIGRGEVKGFDADVQIYRDSYYNEHIITGINNFEPDIIYHLAAKTSVTDNEENSDIAFENDVNGLRIFLSKLKLPKVKIIFTSSCAVYGEDKGNLRYVPIGNYGLNKYLCEQILDHYQIKNPDSKVFIIRLGNTVGRDQKTGFLYKYLKYLMFHSSKKLKYLSGQKFIFTCNSDEVVRSFIFIDDVVCALKRHKFYQDGKRMFRIVNLMSYDSRQISVWADAVNKEFVNYMVKNKKDDREMLRKISDIALNLLFLSEFDTPHYEIKKPVIINDFTLDFKGIRKIVFSMLDEIMKEK